jgi:hypothetical protein
MKMIAALMLMTLAAGCAAQQFPAGYIEASQADLSVGAGQRAPFLFSTLTITIATSTTTTISATSTVTSYITSSTIGTTSTTCTVSTSSACTGKRRRRGILYNEQEPEVDYLGVAAFSPVWREAPVAADVVPSAPVESVETEAEAVREQRSAQVPFFYPVQSSYSPFQSYPAYPAYPRVPYFREGGFGGEAAPNVLYAPEQRFLLTFSTSTSTISTTTYTATSTASVTTYSTTSTSTVTVSITPICSTTSGLSTCASG